MAFMNLFNKKKEGGETKEIAPPPNNSPPPPPSQNHDEFPPPPPAFGGQTGNSGMANQWAQKTGRGMPKVASQTPPPIDPNSMSDIPPPPSAADQAGAQGGPEDDIPAPPNFEDSEFQSDPSAGLEPISTGQQTQGDSQEQAFTGFNKPEFEPPPPMEDPSSGGSEDDIPDDLFSEILGGSQPTEDFDSEQSDTGYFGDGSGSDFQDVEPQQEVSSPMAQQLEEPLEEDEPSMMNELQSQMNPREEQQPEEESNDLGVDLAQVDTSQPLFVSAQSYHDIIKDVNSLTTQIKKFEEIFARIYDFKIQQNDDFENWRKILEFLHKKLSTVDETLYAPKGEKQ